MIGAPAQRHRREGNRSPLKKRVSLSPNLLGAPLLLLVRGAERKEVLRALDGILQPAEQLLQVFAALDEINFRSIDDQQIRRSVAEKEIFVCASHFLEVLE